MSTTAGSTRVDCSLVMGLLFIAASVGCQAGAVLTDGWLVHQSEGLGLFETCMNLQCNTTTPSDLDDEWLALRVVELAGLAVCVLCLVLAAIHIGQVARTGNMYRWLNTALAVLSWLTGGVLLSGGVLLLITESKHYYEQSEPTLKPGYSFALSVTSAILILLATVLFHYEIVQDNRRNNSVKYSRRRRTFRLRTTSSNA